MRSHAVRVWMTLAALLLLPLPARAQGVCAPLETVFQCMDRLEIALKPAPPQAKQDAEKKAKDAQAETPKKTETGLDQISGLGSSVKDFLPLLQLSGLLGAVQKDDRTGTVNVALNLLGTEGGDAAKSNPLQVKAAIGTTTKLFEPLRARLPEKDRDAKEKALLATKTDPRSSCGTRTITSRRPTRRSIS